MCRLILLMNNPFEILRTLDQVLKLAGDTLP
jgi:hypothetical protein